MTDTGSPKTTHLDPDSDYYGMRLNRDEHGRVVLAFGSVLAKRGDKVRFRGEGGWDHELRKASARFKVGDEATVERVRVGTTSSRYIFADSPDDWNTVMFERVPEEAEGLDAERGTGASESEPAA